LHRPWFFCGDQSKYYVAEYQLNLARGLRDGRHPQMKKSENIVMMQKEQFVSFCNKTERSVVTSIYFFLHSE
jgi:hypothetical protein